MKTKDRILALALAVCLLLGMTLYIPGPVAVHAESGCNHVHDEDCGYVEGAPCEHDHDEDCGEDGEDCIHIHDEDCGHIEAAPCTHTHDEDCGGLADSDNGPSLGESGPATPTQIAAFAPLDDTVRVQGFDLGDVTLADLVLPETLEATDESDAPLTVEGVTWACTDPDTGFDAAADGLYTFTPELPGGYTLADGVALPQITVIVRPDGPAIMPLAIGAVQVGDHVYFGQYQGEDILWQVTDVSGGSVELASAYVLWDAQYHNVSDLASTTNLTFDTADIYQEIVGFVNNQSNFDPTNEWSLISAFGLSPDLGEEAYDRSGNSATYWTNGALGVNNNNRTVPIGGGARERVTETHGVRPAITIDALSEYNAPQITGFVPSIPAEEIEKSGLTAPLTVQLTGENARDGDLLVVTMAGSVDAAREEYTISSGDLTGTGAFNQSLELSVAALQALPDGDYTLTASLTRRVGSAETAMHSVSETGYYRLYTEGADYIAPNQDAAETTIISMGGGDWYVIGRSGNLLTLLATDTMGITAFGSNNTYDGSTLQSAMTSIYNNDFSSLEQAAVEPVNLTDVFVDDAELWPLSIDEANAVNQSLRETTSDLWWLRSPGGSTANAAYVDSNGVVYPAGYHVSSILGIRPAFQLNLESAIFTSDPSSGAPGAADTSLTRFSASATPRNLKLTLPGSGSSLNGFSITTPAQNATLSGAEGGTVSIEYSDSTGAAGDEFLRVRLLQDGKTMYTGVVAAPLSASGGNAVIPLTDVEPGIYQAEIWVEQDGGTGMSNTASKPVAFQLTVTPAVTNIAPTINGQTTGTDAISLTEGYAEHTKQFTIAGTPAPILTITADNDNTNASITDTGLLTIPVGLPEGTYTIKFEARNNEGTATMTVTVDVAKDTTPGTTYTITFNENYGSNNTFTTMQTGTDGKLSSLPAAPTRPGSYTFDGWFTQPSGGVEITTNTVFASNDTVYAGWTYTGGGTDPGPNTYTVTYHANGGSGTPPALATVPKNSAYTIAQPGGLTAPAGQRFVEWNTSSTGSGTGYAPGQAITVTGNLTLYAMWETIPQPSYTVTFDPGVGFVTPTSLPTGADGRLAYLPTPTRSGNYVFAGWYTQTNGEGTPITTSTVFAADTTVYAHWTDTSGSGGNNGGGNNNNGGSGGGGSSTPDGQGGKTHLPASAFSWDGERTLTISHDNITALGLTKVLWDGAELTRGTDYTVHQGSVIIRFSEDFMAAQAPGDHTVRVEFMNHTGETTIKLTADTGATDTGTDTHNPSTGGDTQNPQTGDYGPSPYWWLLALIPAAALTIYAAAQLWRRLRRTEG